MQVCLDVQSAIAQRAGVGRYTAQLATHLASLMPPASDDRLRLFSFNFKGKGYPLIAPGTEQVAVRWCPGRIAQRSWRLLGWPPFDAFSGPADLFHFPNFIMPPLRRGKAVVTIHDMSFVRFPEFADSRNVAFLNAGLRGTVARADAIITVSAFSAGEIAELLHVPRERIAAIPLGIADTFGAPPPELAQPIRTRLGLDRPYLLAVGTLEPRKNIPFLIDLFESLTSFDGLLVIAGAPGWKYGPILDRIQRSPVADRIRRLDHVTDDTLPTLYAGAALLIMPSFYEGFGFPPLEAMACGTPVLSSAGGSLPEVVGEAATVMSDFNLEDWREAALALLHDQDLRKTRIATGLVRARQYRWDTTARQTLDLYRRVVGAA